MASKETNIRDVSEGGALAIVLVGILNFYQPELMHSMTGMESALTVLITAFFAYLKEPKGRNECG